MKLSKENLKILIEALLQEDYKGVIGSPLDAEGKRKITKKNPKGEFGEPIVFDSDEVNFLASAFSGDQYERFKDAAKRPGSGVDAQTIQAVGSVPRAPAEKQKRAAGRMFKGKKFTENAKWMMGSRVFPDSDVFIIPIAGGKKEASRLIFGDQEEIEELENKPRYEMTEEEKFIVSNRIPEFELQRNIMFDISGEGISILANLGVSIGEMQNIDVENDIIFIPLVTGTAANFKASPHMIIHALLDTRSRGGADSIVDLHVKPLQAKIREWLLNEKGVMPQSLRPQQDDDKDQIKIAQVMRKVGTTKAFRDDVIFTTYDVISEILTQEMTRSKPPRGTDISLLSGDYPRNTASFSWNNTYLNQLSYEDKFWLLKLGKDIVRAAENIRQGLKGKVIIINVF
jgi:hypothetical protein